MKILYLIHVDWDWIFQRPQILALALDKTNECTVVEQKTVLRSSSVVKKNPRTRNMIHALRLPRERKIKIFTPLNKVLYRMAVKDFARYDMIWICNPRLFDYVPINYTGKIVYDCMDNYVSMAEEALKNQMYDAEQRLIKRADLIFTSSKRLMEVIPNMNNAILVRNGFIPGNIMDIDESKYRDTYQIGYFGTISEWFDFNLLMQSIKMHKNIEYHLIGPAENSRLNKTEKEIIEQGKNGEGQILYHGTIEHSELQGFIQDYDALMMPFKVNETILSVDPVKLYEYISCGKCIISIWYPEIERFSPFVYFYRDKDEYNEIINQLIENGFKPKYNAKEQQEFLEKNTWDERCLKIESEINKLI